MAERDVVIRIRAIDQASAVFNRVALAAGAFVSVWALRRGVVEVTEEFIQAEKSSITLAAALRATGEAAGFTTDELETYADELMRLTTVDDDAFKRIMGIMATFRNVSGDVFKESIELVADMSVQFGGLESGAIRLGKALNDPVRGMTALSRVGIQFSETQKKAIENFVEQGNLMAAQKVILGELTNQFGGQARAQVDSFGGAIAQLANAFGQLKEDMGEFIAEIPGLIEGIRMATVAVEHYRLTWDIVWLQMTLKIGGFVLDFKHFFTIQAPAILQFFQDNWINMLETIGDAISQFFTNLVKNAWSVVLDIKTIITGEDWGGEAFVPLLDGFENTIGKFPELTKRAMTDVEKILEDELFVKLAALRLLIDERLARKIPELKHVVPFGPDVGDDEDAKAAKKRANLEAVESRFLTFGRVAGDAQEDAFREAKKAARIAREQRNKQLIGQKAITRLLSKLMPWAEASFKEAAGEAKNPARLTEGQRIGAFGRQRRDSQEDSVREAKKAARIAKEQRDKQLREQKATTRLLSKLMPFAETSFK